ncbi:nitrogen metabolic regulation nmr [Apiospora arundinis]|uniref:NmrA-like family domain-containing protein 1 n=1 Tax=Apiospora arundinis TaxID=335852 RepID=A0ABR2IVD9_9PEZI
MGRKLIVVCGATGNQGGSVARRFLRDPGFQVRGLTRDTSSEKARELVELGIEMVQADVEDVASLEAGFRGANLIFSVTQYWEPFFRPDYVAAAKEQGVSIRKLAYDVEYRCGRNIADAAAAAALDSLDANGFLVSTLSHAARCSGGRYTDLYHFDAKADIFPDYVEKTYPGLAKRMSCIQTGYFFTSYNILPNSYFAKQQGEGFKMQFPTDPTKQQPHLDVNGDMGNFVYAVHQMPAGKAYMAEGTTCTWPDFLKTWRKATGVRHATYEQVPQATMVAASSGGYEDLGQEVARMFAYSSDPGYDGGMELLRAEDLRKAGIDCPMTSWEDWASRHDWSAILNSNVAAWRAA